MKEPIAVYPKWTRAGLVLVCRKCAKNAPAGSEAASLRSWLKRRLKDDGLAKRIRVVSSGCLDVCPKRAVTVAIEPFAQQSSPACVVVDPEKNRDALYERIVATLGRNEEPSQ